MLQIFLQAAAIIGNAGIALFVEEEHFLQIDIELRKAGLEARILLKTMPETAMVCEDFENYLTDYLDGFLAAPLYHRWERHAALCSDCSELPGQVVRAIGDAMTNKDIAVHFGISEYTVKHHLTKIFDKVGVDSRLELAMFAKHHGLVQETADAVA